MKKKTIAVILTCALVCTVPACGVAGAAETAENEAVTQEEAAVGAEETTKTDTQEAAEETAEADTQEEAKPEGFGSRLVSVDHVEKYVKLAQYKGLALEKPEIEVTDEQVEDEIQYHLQSTLEEVMDTTTEAQNGDTVTINFMGTKDGIAFEGGTAENYELTLGEGGMIAGFEDGIVGMKKGETKDLNLTFPESYYEESLAGADVVFQITLQKIQRAPELSDAWVEANSEVKTVEEYREVIRKDLLEHAEEEAQYGLQISAWNKVYADSEVVEYPEEDIQNAKDEFKYQLMMYIGDSDMSLEEFLESQGYSMEDFEEQSRQYAENKVKQNLIVQGIMDAENLTLDDEKSLEIQNTLVTDYGMEDISGLVEIYGQTAVNEAIGFMRVEQFLVDNATITVAVVDAEADLLTGEDDVIIEEEIPEEELEDDVVIEEDDQIEEDQEEELLIEEDEEE